MINSNAARDLKGNTLNTATTTITSFNDKLAPEVVYIWSNSVINKNSKTFTMIFDITDKYYSSASLAIGDLTIKIGGKTPNWSSNEDVVEPYVQKMSSTVNAPAKTASITVRISDRYFSTSTLTKDTIKVYINGTENASVKTGWSTSEENETRTEKGTTSTVHVATNYTLNMSGFASNINQIKVVVPAKIHMEMEINRQSILFIMC